VFHFEFPLLADTPIPRQMDARYSRKKKKKEKSVGNRIEENRVGCGTRPCFLSFFLSFFFFEKIFSPAVGNR
jgi:hypothetical protein